MTNDKGKLDTMICYLGPSSIRVSNGETIPISHIGDVSVKGFSYSFPLHLVSVAFLIKCNLLLVS